MGIVAITLGNGVDLRIDNDQLFITETTSTGMIKQIIDLGPATMKRFGELSEYLRRLQIHAIEERVLTTTNKRCAECGEPQFDTPSGLTCKNGHGGADSIE